MQPYLALQRIGSWFFVVGVTACFHLDDPQSCPRGQQRVDGHCLPTPTVVFTRCVEAFRTDSVEHDRGREIDVGARAPSGAGGNVRHHDGDRERREFAGLSEDHMAAAIVECRRQEEAERAGQLARAWDEAEQARNDADAARLEARQARWQLERLDRAHQRLLRDGAVLQDEEEQSEALAGLPRPPDDGVVPDTLEGEGDDEDDHDAGPSAGQAGGGRVQDSPPLAGPGDEDEW